MLDSIGHLNGRHVVTSTGEEVGKVTDVIANPNDLRPEWLVVKLGPIAGEHLVPVDAVEVGQDALVVGFERADIKSAPRVHDHTAPTKEESVSLRRHYGLA